MRQFPLIDLQGAYNDAIFHLNELRDIATLLYGESGETWDEMARVHNQVGAALAALGLLPPGILEGIAKAKAALAEMEDRADVSAL